MKLIVITGPTSSGKTELSLKLAKSALGGKAEIISADSRQVYRGMDVGTSKIKLKNGRAGGIRHHLIDVASPKKTFTVVRFKKKAEAAIKKIYESKKIPMIVGGSVFYIEALIYDLKLPAVKPNYTLRKKLEHLSSKQLLARLKKVDPERAKNIDRHNRRRLIRALEIASSLGYVPPLKKKSNYSTLILGIRHSDQTLRRLIAGRIDKRVPGIIREVKTLRKSGVSFDRLVNFGLEYRYFSWYLMNKLTKKEAVKKLKTASWRFAKRQYSFLKHLPVIWVKNQREAEKEIRRFLS